jgi:uncharacterized protein (DUF427 family)
MAVMAKAIWEGTILAESPDTVEVEGNQYFPPASIRPEYFKRNQAHTTCPWKRIASYYDIEVGGKRNSSAAWYYPEPKEAARRIKDYVAFWTCVKVEQ